jgi:Spy/CpxP family protein refolding chaperone
MKRFVVLAITLFAAFSVAAFAQTAYQPYQPAGNSRSAAAQCPTHAVAASCPTDEVIQMMAHTPEPGRQEPVFTPEQLSKVEAVRGSYRDKFTDANSQLQSADWALMNSLASQKIDSAKLQTLIAAAAKADAEAMKITANYWMELKGILTPDQDKKISLWLQKRLMPALNVNPPFVGSAANANGYGAGDAQCPTHAVAASCPTDEVIQMMTPRPNRQNNPGFDLSVEQQQKAEAIRDDYKKKLIDVDSQVQSADWALTNALASQRVDEARLPDLLSTAAKADAEAMKVRANYWIELKVLLTPEQDKQMSSWLQNRLMPALDTNRQGGMGGGYGGYRGGN